MTEWASSSCRSILDDRDARSRSETPLPPRLGSRPKLLFQQDCCSGWMVHSVRLASPESPWELTEGRCQDLSEPWLSLRLSRLERLGSLSEGWNSTVFEQPPIPEEPYVGSVIPAACWSWSGSALNCSSMGPGRSRPRSPVDEQEPAGVT